MNVSKVAPTAARILLGLPYLVFGLNGFFQFIPQPPPVGTAATFLGGLAAAGYFFPLLKATEIVGGLLLLSNRYVPLALTVLAPVTLNILAYHLFLAPATVALPVVMTALSVYLAYRHRDAFAPLFAPRASFAPRETRNEHALAEAT